jgi:hypothetical protein
VNSSFQVGDLVRLVRPCTAIEGERFIGGPIVKIWPLPDDGPLAFRYGVALRNAAGGDGGEEFVQFVKAAEIRRAHN